jgi:hypothetical protein
MSKYIVDTSLSASAYRDGSDEMETQKVVIGQFVSSCRLVDREIVRFLLGRCILCLHDLVLLVRNSFVRGFRIHNDDSKDQKPSFVEYTYVGSSRTVKNALLKR